jgi:RNA polymerase sigma-70 factor (ECF subfamily)
MTNRDEDLVLVERIRQGDAESFSRLYERYRDRVYGFSYRMLGIQSTAEDVTHEVFLVLIQSPEKYEAERGSMLTFLCTIARNYILNQFRRRSYEVEDSFDEQELALIRDEYEADPLSSLIEQELTAKIDEYIALLPPLQREVIILRKFQELSYFEISLVTGTDVNVVKARLHRGASVSGEKSCSVYDFRRRALSWIAKELVY